MKNIIRQDMKRIFDGLTEEERDSFKKSTILFTGAAGFLGFYFINFMTCYQKELEIKRIVCLDNFQNGYPKWISKIAEKNCVELYKFNVITDNIEDIPGAESVDYIYHMASIASPIFYRKYPIETMDANIRGLRSILEFYCERKIKGLAFFSSSEIYGDPTPGNIPTPETYRGNVDCQGARACYDESKRFGETMCYLFHEKYHMPITIIRPFNNYGPGMRLNDSRVPADFANELRQNRDIKIFSDGSPMRTFCYISDAITGYLKALCYAQKGFETFNIGIDQPEISISQLAEIYLEAGKDIFGYKRNYQYVISKDKNYLQNNPNRRCPNIEKARRLLGYRPQVNVKQGVRYFLEYINECSKEEVIW